MDPGKFHVVVLVWVIIHEASVIKNAIEYIVGVVEARANLKKKTRDCIEKYEEQPEQPNVFKFSSAYITRQCRWAKELCALQLACDVKLELHAPTLLYNICWSDSVGALSTHVFRLFFCWMMFEDLSNICPTKDIEQTWVLNVPALSDQQMLCIMFQRVARLKQRVFYL